MSENPDVAKVYGKPDCYGCKLTVKVLEKEGIPYKYLDITTNEVAYQEVKNLGYNAAPVVDAGGGQHWTGFSPDRIRGLKRD